MVVFIGVQHPALLVGHLVALAAVHAGLAYVACDLRARVLVRSAAAAATAAAAAAALLYLVETVADCFEGGPILTWYRNCLWIRHVEKRKYKK